MFDKFIHKTLRRPYRLKVISDIGVGVPVVLLHGIASDSRTWRHVLPLMPKTMRSISIDLLGFGKSPKPDWNEYKIQDHANSVAKTLKKLHLGQPAIIVGHSMGSLIAVSLAKHHPKTVKSLILCSMPIYINEQQKGSIDSYSKADSYLNSLYFRAYNAIRQRPDFTIKNAERIKKVSGGDTSFGLTKETWIPFKNSLQNTIESQTTLADINSIKKPIDIIYGRLDMLVIGSYLKEAAKNNPEIKLHKVIAGHEITPKYATTIANIIKA